MAVWGAYTFGSRSHLLIHSGFTLDPMRVSSGPMSPPTINPAAFCTAWHDAQKDSPYTLAPSCASAGTTAGDFELPAGSVAELCAIKNAEMSRASASLSLKSGMVADTE